MLNAAEKHLFCVLLRSLLLWNQFYCQFNYGGSIRITYITTNSTKVDNKLKQCSTIKKMDRGKGVCNTIKVWINPNIYK